MTHRAPRLFRACFLLAISVAAFLAAQPTMVSAQEDAQARTKFLGAKALQDDELYDAAADAWKQLIKDHPTSSLVPVAKFNLGVCYLITKKHGPAVETFDDLVKAPKDLKEKDLERAYLYLGAEQVELGRETKKKELFEQAVATLDALLKKWPKGKGRQADLAYYYRAEANYALGKKTAAVSDYATVAKEFPNSSKLGDALYSQGFTLQESEQWEPAAEAYSAFLKNTKLANHPLHTEVRMRHGETLLERRQYTAAEAELKAAADTKGFGQADYATLRLAESYTRRNKHAEAADLYLSIPEKFPDLKNVQRGHALLEGGKSAYLAGQYAKARAALSKVIPLGGDRASEAGHWIARSFLQEQKPSEALKAAEAALPAAKGTAFEADLLLDQADALYEIPEQRKRSIAVYYDLANKASEPRVAQQALYNAAFAAMKTDDLATALKYCDEFLTKHKSSALANEVRFVQAESLLQSKKYEEAAGLYQQLIEAAPEHAEHELWRVRLGQCHYLRRNYKDAADTFKAHLASIKRPLLRAEANYQLGGSLVELGKHDEALKPLEESLSAPADWPLADDARVMLARALRQRKDRKREDYQKAVKHLQEVLAMTDSNVLEDAYYQLAECHYELGDYKTAAEEFRQVIAKGDDRYVPFALFGLGWTHLKQNDATKAIESFSQLINRPDEHPQAKRAYLARGAAYQQLKQFEKAEADLRKFLELEPAAPEKSDVRFEIGRCQSAQKKHAEAEKTFASILSDDSGYARGAEVLYELAWALNDQGKAADAVKRFEELAKSRAENPLAVDALVQIGEIRFREKGASGKPDYAAASKAFYEVNDKAQKLVTAGKLSPERAAVLREQAMHKYGWCHFHQDDFVNAEKTFKYQLTQWPKGELAADGEFMVAESLHKQSKYAAASSAFRDYVKNHPEGRFAPTAIWHAAEAANRLGIEEYAKAVDAAARKRALAYHQQALDLVADFATKYPEFESLPEVSYEEAQAHQYLGKSDTAIPIYEAITSKTNREVAAKARFMIGELHFEKATRATSTADKQKALQEAIKHFYNVAFGYGYPAWQANALYEAARCLEQLGTKNSTAKAKERYQEIIDKFPTSDKAPLARKRLAQLGQ